MSEPRPTIRALRRGLEVLRILQEGPGTSLQGLHAATKLPKPTLLRIINTLEDAGLARRGLDDRLYHVGSDAGAPPYADRATDEFMRIATPVLAKLCERVLWPSDLAIRHGTVMHIRETNTRSSPIQLRRYLGGYYPPILLSALGRAYLAFCPEDEQREILSACLRSRDPNAKLARDPGAIATLIAETRAQGYGVIDPNLETPGRLKAIAVPIRQGDLVRGCINIVWPPGAADLPAIVARHLPSLREAARDVARRLATKVGQE